MMSSVTIVCHRNDSATCRLRVVLSIARNARRRADSLAAARADYIAALHCYNEARDMCGDCVTVISEYDGATSTEIYDQLGIDVAEPSSTDNN